MDANEAEKRTRDIEMTALRSDTDSSTTTLLDHMESDDRAKIADPEKDAAAVSSAPSPIKTNRVTLTLWMLLNTLATVAIVSGPVFHVFPRDEHPTCVRNAHILSIGLPQQSHSQ